MPNTSVLCSVIHDPFCSLCLCSRSLFTLLHILLQRLPSLVFHPASFASLDMLHDAVLFIVPLSCRILASHYPVERGLLSFTSAPHDIQKPLSLPGYSGRPEQAHHSET